MCRDQGDVESRVEHAAVLGFRASVRRDRQVWGQFFTGSAIVPRPLKGDTDVDWGHRR